MLVDFLECIDLASRYITDDLSMPWPSDILFLHKINT